MKNFITKILKREKKSPEQTYGDTPAIGQINFGDLRRLKPISNDFGFRRGGPVDRYYIERFLKENAADIKGHALEVKDDHYLKMFGGSKVTKADILDIDPNNPAVTVIADLAAADHIPSNTYDCIVLTQVLQLIFDLRSAIKHLHRILKPGGVLIITVPGISHFVYKCYANYWCWCFTENSARKLLQEVFSESKVKTAIHGNVLVATSFLQGIGAGELTEKEFNYSDPDYQVIITAKAVK